MGAGNTFDAGIASARAAGCATFALSTSNSNTGLCKDGVLNRIVAREPVEFAIHGLQSLRFSISVDVVKRSLRVVMVHLQLGRLGVVHDADRDPTAKFS